MKDADRILPAFEVLEDKPRLFAGDISLQVGRGRFNLHDTILFTKNIGARLPSFVEEVIHPNGQAPGRVICKAVL